MNIVYIGRVDEKKIIKLNSELQAMANDDKVLSEQWVAVCPTWLLQLA